ncbi:MAG: hypothetical protein PHW53_00600 [Patescibacteria group bacterium]|nr:hypothetical protein [Patescibacteria group bacterium]
MLIVTHAITGAVVGQLVKNSYISFLASLVLHFLMDIIPHGDTEECRHYRETNRVSKKLFYQLAFDIIIMTALAAYLLIFKIQGYWWPTLAGILGGILPDMIVAFHEYKPNRITAPIHWIHFWCHNIITDRAKDIRLRYAIILQLVAITVIIAQFL